MRYLFIIFIFISLTFKGISYGKNYDVYFDANISEDIRNDAIKAMNEWTNSSHSEINFTVLGDISYTDYVLHNSNDDSIFIRESDSTHDELKELYNYDSQTIAFAYRVNPRQIVILKDVVASMSLNDEEVKSVFLHEFGHIFNMWHSRSKDSIMYPLFNKKKTSLSERDVLFYCSVNDC